MELEYKLSELFSSEIIAVNNKLELLTTTKTSSNNPRSVLIKDALAVIINRLGLASAKAQSLPVPITSSRKFQISSHILFILLDLPKNSVVGLIKIGVKKLFVYDRRGIQREMECLCVLDFYVHESYQRSGMGKKLFDYMIQFENLNPVHLAIDRPSYKMQSFLKKHYNMVMTIPQVNNFVVYEGFFSQQTKPGFRLQSRNSFGKPPRHPSSFGDTHQNVVSPNNSSVTKQVPFMPLTNHDRFSDASFSNNCLATSDHERKTEQEQKDEAIRSLKLNLSSNVPEGSERISSANTASALKYSRHEVINSAPAAAKPPQPKVASPGSPPPLRRDVSRNSEIDKIHNDFLSIDKQWQNCRPTQKNEKIEAPFEKTSWRVTGALPNKTTVCSGYVLPNNSHGSKRFQLTRLW